MAQERLHCASCNSEYDAATFETMQHLEFLIAWLNAREDALHGAQFDALRQHARSEHREVRLRLGLEDMPQTPPPLIAAAPDASPHGSAAPLPVPTPSQTRVPLPTRQPAGLADETETIREPPPAARPARREPRKPLVDWAKVREQIGNAASSGALLRALLYLGAFMIVVSLAILVVRFWDRFPSIVQVAFIFSVPAAFYGTGFLLYRRIGLRQTGSVLVAIGALLVAVDFAAIYQFGHLSTAIRGELYWLITAAICTAIYVATAWQLPVAIMAYTIGLGAANLFAAVAACLELPFPWWAAAGGLSAYPFAFVAARLRRGPERWATLAKHGCIWCVTVLAAAQVASLVLPGRAPWAPVASFIAGALGYAWLASQLNVALLIDAASWSAAIAAFLALRALRVPWEWRAAGMALIALGYLAGSAWLQARRAASGQPVLEQHALRALRITAGALFLAVAVASIALLFFEVWAGIGALVIVSGGLLAWAVLFRAPRLLAAACGLFVVPFTAATATLITGRAAPLPVWLEASWVVAASVGLALAYLSAGAVMHRWQAYAHSLHLSSHLLVPLAGFGLAMVYLIQFSLASTRIVAGYPSLPLLSAPSTLAAGLAVLVYVGSAMLHHSKSHPGLSRLVARLPRSTSENAFLWPAAALIPFCVVFGTLWLAPGLPGPWVGAQIAAIGLTYVWLGTALARAEPSYRLPPQIVAYALAPIGIIAALPNTWSLFAALLLAIATIASLSIVMHRHVEAIIAALLVIWPFQIALDQARLAPQVQVFAYALLGCLGYIPLGLAWLRRETSHRVSPDTLIMLGIGYATAGIAVAVSMAGRYLLSWPDLPWVRVLTALAAAGLALFSVYRFRDRVFAWIAVLLVGLAFGEALEAARIPTGYVPVAWTGAALVAVIAAWAMSSERLPLWMRLLKTPGNAGALIAAVIGLALTAPATLQAFALRPVGDFLPLILAQSIAVVALVVAALLNRSALVLAPAPYLAFFPVTLCFIGYGSELIGKPLTSAEYALVWTGLALLYLAAATITDRQPIRYARGLYAGGYLLLLFAVVWSTTDRKINLIVAGTALVVTIASQILDHFGRHRTFRELVCLVWRKPESLGRRGGQLAFLFIAAYATPAWVIQLLVVAGVPMAWRGFALAALAAVYVAVGLLLGRAKHDYRVPLFTAGYTLTGLAVLVAANDEPMAIAVLAIDAVIYSASALIFRQPFWLYLANGLAPVIVLLLLHATGRLTAAWSAPALMILSAIDTGVGMLVQRPRVRGEDIRPFALPFLAVGYLLSAVALAAGSGSRAIALPIYAAGAIIYALSAWLLREPLFIYPAALTTIVPYYLAMTLTPLPAEWYAMGLLPLAAAFVALGRTAFDRNRTPVRTWQERLDALTRPEMPLYLAGYGVTVGMLIQSAPHSVPRTVTLAVLAAVYLGSAALFHSWLWLYPGLLAVHAALGAGLSLLDRGGDMAETAKAALPFHLLTWVMVGFAFGFSRARLRPVQKPANRALTLMTTPSWAQPFALFAALDIVVWQGVAMFNLPVAVIYAAGNAVMLALLALLWLDLSLPYLASGFALLAFACLLAHQGASASAIAAGITAAGLVLYLAGALLTVTSVRLRWLRAVVWPPALARVGFIATTLAFPIAIATSVSGTPLAASGALACTGGLYLAIAYRRRSFILGYGALSMLLAAWIIALLVQSVRQPQAYAIAAGVYVATVGVLERRRGNIRFGCALESLGVTIPLGTAFIQSVRSVNALPYIVLVLLQSALVIWWSASRRVKLPFFIGVGFSVMEVIAQLVILATVNDVLRWVIILGAGLAMVGGAILAERRRAAVADRLRGLEAAMHGWQI